MNGASPSSRDNLIIKVIAFFSLAIIAFYLITEHKAHLLAYSSYIIFGVFILAPFHALRTWRSWRTCRVWRTWRTRPGKA